MPWSANYIPPLCVMFSFHYNEDNTIFQIAPHCAVHTAIWMSVILISSDINSVYNMTTFKWLHIKSHSYLLSWRTLINDTL